MNLLLFASYTIIGMKLARTALFGDYSCEKKAVQ